MQNSTERCNIRSTNWYGISMFKLKRAYEPPAPEDGLRVLVDRRWPCGVIKSEAGIDVWLKDIAPSNELTIWFNRDPAKWDEFRHRYWKELHEKPEQIEFLEEKAAHGTVTLVYRAKDTQHNSALALLQYLEQRQRLTHRRAA